MILSTLTISCRFAPGTAPPPGLQEMNHMPALSKGELEIIGRQEPLQLPRSLARSRLERALPPVGVTGDEGNL